MSDDQIEHLRTMAKWDSEYRETLNCAADRIEQLKTALRWSMNILENMAQENEGAIFFRWPIHHEPLRADARAFLPIARKALEGEND